MSDTETMPRVRGYEERLRARGGAVVRSLYLQPETAAAVQRLADEWRRSRQWTINELIRLGAEVRS